MKWSKILFLTLGILLNYQISMGQDIFTPVDENVVQIDSDKQTLLSNFSNNPDIVNSSYAQVKDIIDNQTDGKLLFSSTITGQHLLRAIKVEFTSKSNYKWIGETYDKQFNLIIIKNDSGYQGTINDAYTDKFFRFFPINNNQIKIFEINKNTSIVCNIESSAPPSSPVGPENCDDVCPSHIEILFLLTPEAQDWMVNTNTNNTLISGYLNLLISDLELAFINSEIQHTVSFTWEEFDWTPTPINNCQADAIALSNNPDAQLIRSQNNSDLVFLLAPPNTNWQTANDNNQACTAEIGPLFDDAYGIIPVELAATDYIFPHELGHLIGAEHDLSGSAQDCPSGHVLFHGGVSYPTILKTVASGQGRIPFFSNPDINWAGQPTGTSDRFNAGRMNEVGCIAGDFFISDQIEIIIETSEDNCLLNLNAIVSPPNNYLYNWYWSLDGLFTNQYPGQSLATGNNLAIPEPFSVNCESYFIQLQLELNGVIVGTKVIRVLSGICVENVLGCSVSALTASENNNALSLQHIKIENNIKNHFEQNIKNNYQQKINVFNIQGQFIKSISNFNQLRDGVNNLPSGIYLIFYLDLNNNKIVEKYFHQNIK